MRTITICDAGKNGAVHQATIRTRADGDASVLVLFVPLVLSLMLLGLLVLPTL